MKAKTASIRLKENQSLNGAQILGAQKASIS
jgi:hypothetical protein